MKQKYVVLLENDENHLIIQEYAELDKEMLSLLCEETYTLDAVKTAADKSRNALIQALRTHNMYPPGNYIEQIADAIIEMFQPGANTSAELFFEEKDLFGAMEKEAEDDAEESEDDDSGLDVDELLDDDIDDDFEDKGIPKDLEKSIKGSDEDTDISNS